MSGHRTELVFSWEIAKDILGISRQEAESAKSKICKLIIAIVSGDLDDTKELVAKGADIHTKTVDGGNSLHVATKHAEHPRNFKVLQFIISKCKDINATNDDGLTALHMAAELGKVNVVEALLKKKANANAKANDGTYPLHIATESCKSAVRLEVLRMIIKKSSNIDAVNNAGQTALHIAVENGVKLAFKALLEAGADVNAQTGEGWTCLHYAAARCDKRTIEVLLKKGADVQAKTHDGSNAIHIAARSLDNYDTESKKPCALIDYLIKCGIDVHAKDNEGKTPVHVALDFSYFTFDIFWHLMKKGTKRFYKSNDGTTILHAAVSNRRIYREEWHIQQLINLGFKLDIQNANGETPLHVACIQGNDVVICELLQSGAALYLDLETKDGLTAYDIVYERLGGKFVKDDDLISNVHYFEVAMMLKVYIVMLKVAGFQLREKTVQVVEPHDCKLEASYWSQADIYSPELSDLLREGCPLCECERICKEELERMKNHKICGTTLFDIFTLKGERSEELCKEVELVGPRWSDISKSYNMYDSLFWRKLDDGQERNVDDSENQE